MRGNRTESGTGGGSDEGLFDPFAPSPRGFTGEPSWYDNAKDWVVDAAGLATLVGYAVDTTSGATLTVADAVRRG
jgi:hypothetical protein